MKQTWKKKRSSLQFPIEKRCEEEKKQSDNHPVVLKVNVVDDEQSSVADDKECHFQVIIPGFEALRI